MFPKYTLRQLSYFVAAAEAGATNRAADAFYISQSAISASLTDLENAMGVQLLVRRKGKGLQLTESGRLLLPEARRLLADAQELSVTAAELQTALTGRLTIGCYGGLAPTMLPRMIAGFEREYPEVQVDFIEGSQPELAEAMYSGRIEVVILFASNGLEGMASHPLGFPTAHALVPDKHWAANLPSVALADLAAEPFIYMNTNPNNQFIEQSFEIADVSPKIRFRSDNFDLIKALVKEGLGYTILMQGSSPGRSRWEPGLQAIPLREDIPSDSIVVAKLEGFQLTRKGRHFWEYLVRTHRPKAPVLSPDSPDSPGTTG